MSHLGFGEMSYEWTVVIRKKIKQYKNENLKELEVAATVHCIFRLVI